MNKKIESQLFFTKEGNGNDVLFLHGWGCSGSIFCSLLSRLKDYTTILVDMWGFGNTPLPKEANSGWSAVDYAHKIAQFIINNNLTNLTVVGHSFGGRVGIVLASEYPDLVKKLVLVSSAGLKRFSLKKSLKIMRYKYLKRRSTTNEKFLKKLKEKGSDDFKACNNALKPTFLKVVNQSLESYAPRIKCSTLLIWGQKDKETPLWMAKCFKKLIPKSGLVIMKNCGHYCFLENSNLFIAVLKSFLNSEEE